MILPDELMHTSIGLPFIPWWWLMTHTGGNSRSPGYTLKNYNLNFFNGPFERHKPIFSAQRTVKIPSLLLESS